ncbi:hemicentin-1-like [Dendronephthya gigantea]|uniref:hemicentin-1-like n=1 Tax=Dendronephthya gigantea TaxID=151771 RepID=UPI0010694916|nr:hemicentin-1-like [Dendronephthya gigantea]
MNYLQIPPEVQLVVDKTNVTVGDLVTIRCSKITPGRPESKISWYHNDKLVPGKNKEYLFNQTEIEAKDAGSYRCVAENDAGTDESNIISITTLAIDMMFERIEPQTVLVGNDATFRWKKIGTEPMNNLEYYVCSPSLPKLVYYYLKGGKPKYYKKEIKRYASAVEWTGNISKNEYAFTLRNVAEFSHEKKFCLKVQYENAAIVWFNTTALFISVPPEVHLLVDKTNVTVGDLVTIECSIVNPGRPVANISWYHNDKLLPGKNEEYLFNQREIEAKDAGSYRCVAKNDAGTDKSNAIKISAHAEISAAAGDRLGKRAIAGIMIGVTLVVSSVVRVM